MLLSVSKYLFTWPDFSMMRKFYSETLLWRFGINSHGKVMSCAKYIDAVNKSVSSLNSNKLLKEKNYFNTLSKIIT